MSGDVWETTGRAFGHVAAILVSALFVAIVVGGGLVALAWIAGVVAEFFEGAASGGAG